jgi:protoporphyrinogen oxidase
MVALETADGLYQDADFLFTVPTTTLADLLRAAAPDEAARLDQIRYFGAVCTILELDRPLSGTYWLNVADEGFPFGAVVEQTNLIDRAAYGGSHVAYLSRYFAQHDPLMQASEAEVIDLMLPPLERIYPDLRRDQIKNVFVFKARTAAPVCDLGFSRKVPACRAAIERLYVASMCHVYPDERSVNNSIRVAAEACRVMGMPVTAVPARASLAGQIGFGSNRPEPGP